jgi:hypothetical protein
MNAAYRRPSPCRLIPALRKPPCDRLGNRLTAEIAAVSLTLASLAAFRASAPTMPGALSLSRLRCHYYSKISRRILYLVDLLDVPHATGSTLEGTFNGKSAIPRRSSNQSHRPRAAKAKWRTRRLKLGPIGAFIAHDMFSNSATGVSKRGATPNISRPH